MIQQETLFYSLPDWSIINILPYLLNHSFHVSVPETFKAAHIMTLPLYFSVCLLRNKDIPLHNHYFFTHI